MIVAGRRLTGAVLRPMMPTLNQDRARNFGEAEIFAYISKRSGEYDEIERVIVPDPYADGWRLHDDGKPIESTDEPSSRVRKSVRARNEILRRNGWLDAQSYAKRKAANNGIK